jgi:hypothetical protein
LARAPDQAYKGSTGYPPASAFWRTPHMQSQEMEMKRVLKTVARLLMRVAQHRAEQFVQRQHLLGVKLPDNYRSNAGGWN